MNQNANDDVNNLNTSKSITNRSSLNERPIIYFIKENMLHERKLNRDMITTLNNHKDHLHNEIMR